MTEITWHISLLGMVKTVKTYSPRFGKENRKKKSITYLSKTLWKNCINKIFQWWGAELFLLTQQTCSIYWLSKHSTFYLHSIVTFIKLNKILFYIQVCSFTSKIGGKNKIQFKTFLTTFHYKSSVIFFTKTSKKLKAYFHLFVLCQRYFVLNESINKYLGVVQKGL